MPSRGYQSPAQHFFWSGRGKNHDSIRVTGWGKTRAKNGLANRIIEISQAEVEVKVEVEVEV